MDVKSLVIGQVVYLKSGVYCATAKVIKVTPEGVEVLIPSDQTGKNELRVKFDLNGEECTYPGEGRMGTYECGPWELGN